MKLFVDLDDTLVSSTKLNNDAYNFALEKFKNFRIQTNERITREKLKGFAIKELENIIKEKQQYFSLAWLKYRVVINEKLINKIKEKGKSNSFVWTAADKDRTEVMLKQLGLHKLFSQIIYDAKTDFDASIKLLSERAKSRHFIICENNWLFFQNKEAKIVDKIEDDFFNVRFYKI